MQLLINNYIIKNYRLVGRNKVLGECQTFK